MVVLEQDMKLEVSLCFKRRNKTVLVWEASKLDDMAKKVPVAYTAEVDKKGKSQ